MAKITNSDTQNAAFTPGAAGIFTMHVTGGRVMLSSSPDGAQWADIEIISGRKDVNNVSGHQYAWRYVPGGGQPIVRADQ